MNVFFFINGDLKGWSSRHVLKDPRLKRTKSDEIWGDLRRSDNCMRAPPDRGKGHQRSSTPPQGPRPFGLILNTARSHWGWAEVGHVRSFPPFGNARRSPPEASSCGDSFRLQFTLTDLPACGAQPVYRVNRRTASCLEIGSAIDTHILSQPVQLRRLLGDATFLGTSLPEKQSEMGPGRNCGLIYRTPCFAGSLRANLCSLQVDLQRARSSSAYLLQLRPHLLRGMP